jgi:hypothetical protein
VSRLGLFGLVLNSIELAHAFSTPRNQNRVGSARRMLLIVCRGDIVFNLCTSSELFFKRRKSSGPLPLRDLPNKTNGQRRLALTQQRRPPAPYAEFGNPRKVDPVCAPCLTYVHSPPLSLKIKA